MRLLWGSLLLLLSLYCGAATEPAVQAKVSSQTRETDYTIGSVAKQHLIIEVPAGYVLDEGSIPEKGVTEAVELRDIHWQVDNLKKISRYSFVVEWQIFVAFETVKSIPLRNLELVFKNNQKSISVSVPPDTVLVSNLLPPKMDAKHVQPYPDVLPIRINTLPLWAGLLLALAVLLASCIYIAWFAGWITLPSEKAMPFRQAWREIKRLSNKKDSSTHQAMRILGQALSQYAGYTVTIENLSSLIAKTSQLQPYAETLNTFYQDLQQTFFAGSAPQSSLASMQALAKKLSKLELS